MRKSVTTASVAVFLVGVACAWAADAVGRATADHPEWDAAYTQAIRQFTTAPNLITPLVDHLPASATVPSPLAHHGYVAGAEGHLTYAADVHAYMRALAAASPRVEVFSIGTSEEGREMIAVAIADETTIAHLDEFRQITARLADPRRLGEGDAADLVARGKPIYYLTGGLHSPETGSPEMLMELAYRLAVEDTDLVRSIRDNVITLITPVLEVDGRERMVDTWRAFEANPDGPVLPLVYWGHYVAHDNNRDFIGMALALTRNVEKTYFEWHPQVLHDLHESIPFLYVSSGTGPYNAWLDPLTVDWWEKMAIHEVDTLTSMGLPGVWTHGFYDGWAPNYLFWVALGHNSLGRFYETFGNRFPTTEDRVVRGTSDREWFRPNPPLPKVRWSLRDNVNYQESGALVALANVAAHREETLQRFYDVGRRAVAKARTEGPAAYVFDAAQPRRGQLRDLLALLGRHGVEVQVAEKAFSVAKTWPPKAQHRDEGASRRGSKHDEKTGEMPVEGDATLSFSAGSFVVRMDQPYSRLADALLDTQFVRGEEQVYDDTGWTQGYERNLEFARVVDTAVLDVPMHPWAPSGEVSAVRMSSPFLAVENHADTDLVRLRTAVPDAEMRVAEGPIPGTPELGAGTVVVTVDDASRDGIAAALGRLDLRVHPLSRAPQVAMHPFALPRLALLHSWAGTQDEGWYRLALEDLGVPYTYISTQDVARGGDLGERFDVIVFPPVGWAGPEQVVQGLPPGPPLPWEPTPLTPNLDVDTTPDVRGGLGIEGLAALRRFVEGGGVLVTADDTAELAVRFGLAPLVSVAEVRGVKARGSLLRAEVADAASPVLSGYDATLPVYFSGGPVFTVGSRGGRRGEGGGERPSGRGSATDPDVPQGRPFVAEPERPDREPFALPENMPQFSRAATPLPQDRPRVLLKFPASARDILLSGMLEGGDALAGKAVAVDAPVGKGHVVLLGFNPMWRAVSQGTYAIVTNTLLSAANLGIGVGAAEASAAP